MLRAKQRKITSKSIQRTKRTILSSSTRSLKTVSDTKWMILCGVIIFIITIWMICNIGISNKDSNTPTNNRIDTKINTNNAAAMDTYMAGSKIIYVSVATLGDHACPMTINDLYKQAKYPSNIYVGIYQQNEGNDPDCLAMLQYCNTNNNKNNPITHPELGDISILCNMKDNIVINRTNIADGAKGPVYGRYMSMKLISTFESNNNHITFDFICMIDSHTLFRIEWDDFTITMWYSIEPDHTHAVITHYPWGAEHLIKRITEENEYSYHICGSIYEGQPNYMIRNANGCFAKNAKIPIRVPFFAGGFSFATYIFWQQVPLDPYLLYIFNGEEFDIATRGWTHGYDFYSPHTDIVGHYYDKGPKRRSPHVGINKESHVLRDKSEKRLNYMWGLWNIRYPNYKDLSIKQIAEKCQLNELSKYGLGTKRTLKQYWQFAGVDPINKTITVFKESLYAQGGLDYVPY